MFTPPDRPRHVDLMAQWPLLIGIGVVLWFVVLSIGVCVGLYRANRPAVGMGIALVASVELVWIIMASSTIDYWADVFFPYMFWCGLGVGGFVALVLLAHIEPERRVFPRALKLRMTLLSLGFAGVATVPFFLWAAGYLRDVWSGWGLALIVVIIGSVVLGFVTRTVLRPSEPE